MTDVTTYISVADLKQRMNITDDVDDVLIASVIEAVSRQVDAVTGRFFGKRGTMAPITKRFTANCFNLVYVDDLVSATAVAADLQGLRTYEGIFDPADYELAPYGSASTSEPFTRIEFFSPTLTTYLLPVGLAGAVAVTGVWGWPSVPAPVVQATALQSHRIWQRRQAPFGVSGSNEMGQVRALTKIDPDLELLLNQYIPIVIG